ncbi:MAG: hypothetical protein IJ566_06215 [Cardiobacteriaceae bacterium]|nr:hypothetical protein [Cardiobacteriaceae bacterium]
MKKSIFILLSLLFLFSCSKSLTPEELAQKELLEKEAQRQLAIDLAQKCDPETAALMRNKYNLESVNQAQNQAFDTYANSADFVSQNNLLEAQYQAKINNPVFQNCYQMAKENYVKDYELTMAERRLRAYHDDWFMPHIGLYYGVGYVHHHRPHHRPPPPPRHQAPPKP